MFCKSCGSKLNEGIIFCTACGTKLEAAQPVRQAQNSARLKQETQECAIRFLPRKIFGQYLLRKAAIVIDGSNIYKTKIKKPLDFTVQSGSHSVLAYGDFMGQSCKTQATYNFDPGKQYLIRYKSSVFVFLKGKIKIEEYPIDTVLPMK